MDKNIFTLMLHTISLFLLCCKQWWVKLRETNVNPGSDTKIYQWYSLLCTLSKKNINFVTSQPSNTVFLILSSKTGCTYKALLLHIKA